MQYAVGRAAFRHLELAVDRRVLIPRPETEMLVELVLGLSGQGGTAADIGTGSGAIALALASEEGASTGSSRPISRPMRLQSPGSTSRRSRRTSAG